MCDLLIRIWQLHETMPMGPTHRPLPTKAFKMTRPCFVFKLRKDSSQNQSIDLFPAFQKRWGQIDSSRLQIFFTNRKLFGVGSWRRTMYPRVKVRVKVKEQEHEDQSSVQEKQRNSLLLLKVLESLSLQDRSPDIPSGADLVSSAVNEYQNASPPSIARIPKSYVPGSAKRSVSVFKGAGKNNKETNEDNRPNIRASSVPRPRAVLSSPDNDEMIGNKNKLSRERPSALKMHNLEQKRPADRRSTERHIIPRSPAKTRSGSKEAADKKSDLKGKESPEPTGSRQKAYLRKGKLGSTGI